jgi:hypothetical protein
MQEAIFYPAAALVLLTLLVLALIPYRRFKAAFARQVNAGDFRYGDRRACRAMSACPTATT